MDCANGVGAAALDQLLQKLQGKLHMNLLNIAAGVSGGLNEGCGADFVQKERTAPRGFAVAEASGRSVMC